MRSSCDHVMLDTQNYTKKQSLPNLFISKALYDITIDYPYIINTTNEIFD